MSPNGYSSLVEPRQFKVYLYTCSLFLTIFSHTSIYFLPKGDTNDNIGNMCTIILYSDFIKHAHLILVFTFAYIQFLIF